MTPPTAQSIKVAALVALTAAGAGLIALQHAQPQWSWIGVAIAVCSSLVLGLSSKPSDAKTIAEQHEMLARAMKRLDDVDAADRSTKR